MKPLAIISTVAMLSFGISAMASAADKGSVGKQEYDSNCAVCHGLTGKGDGHFVQFLRNGIPDLTVLSKQNKGVYPFDRLYKVIDGRQPLKGHGTEEMPIWGKQYRAEAMQESYLGARHAEDIVRARILALVEYISQLQQ